MLPRTVRFRELPTSRLRIKNRHELSFFVSLSLSFFVAAESDMNSQATKQARQSYKQLRNSRSRLYICTHISVHIHVLHVYRVIYCIITYSICTYAHMYVRTCQVAARLLAQVCRHRWGGSSLHRRWLCCGSWAVDRGVNYKGAV